MEITKKQWIIRMITGGAAGVALHMLLGYLLGCFQLIGPSEFTGFRFPDCNISAYNYKLEWLGVLLSFALFFLFGAEVGVATLPFADSGKSLVLRSLAHFAAMAVTVSLWAGLNFPREIPEIFLWFLIPLTLVYLLVWLGRWVGWYVEAAAIREKLGLAPGPSLLHWKESLPHVGFAFLLCLLLPFALRWCDGYVPILSIMYGFLLLPIGGFMSGLSLGRRHGFCPLYPLACAGFILLFIPLARLVSNMADGHLVPIAFVPALLGNGAGAVWRGIKRRKAGAVHTC